MATESDRCSAASSITSTRPHPHLALSVDDGIARLTIDRPDKRNALTLAMWRAIGRIMTELDERADVRAIVLTGAGTGFSAGADISEFATVRANAEQADEYEAALDECCDAVEAVSKPTIAAINGFCMGGAVNLVMSCDFRHAVPSAEFSIPAAHLSIVYGIKGTRRLFHLVGIANAKHILFSGLRLNADTAYRIGLVDDVADDVLARACAAAAQLAKNAPLSISGAKAMLNSLASDAPISAQAAHRLVTHAAAGEDYAEGRQAFAQKRTPVFRGR